MSYDFLVEPSEGDLRLLAMVLLLCTFLWDGTKISGAAGGAMILEKTILEVIHYIANEVTCLTDLHMSVKKSIGAFFDYRFLVSRFSKSPRSV